MTTRNFRPVLTVICTVFFVLGCGVSDEAPEPTRPNILFAISDDQSWLHAGAYGDTVVRTPAFDRIACEGVLFTHAFTASPSCTPSRSAILTGQDIWRLGEGGVLLSPLPAEFDVFPLMLEQAGYAIGNTGKAWGPGSWRDGGRDRDPVGPSLNDAKVDAVPKGTRPTDYAANFELFLDAKPDGQPFFFWYGASEPHRPYAVGSGVEGGKSLDDVKVPPFMPDTPEIRGDILDYYMEVEWFDAHLAKMLAALEARGELENTLIVVTSDNGMPFPRAKTNLYDYGVRMPLAVRWGAEVPAGRTVDDFVNHIDFAPTFLKAAGVEPAAAMTGRSLVDLLRSEKQGRVDPDRDYVVTAIERHTWCRDDGLGYPSRAIRNYDFLYIRNYAPDRWPAGGPRFVSSHQGFFGDIDDGASKEFMMRPEARSEFVREFELSFGKRPAEELYETASDPAQIQNLADDAAYAEVKQQLRSTLEAYLAEHDDPRTDGKSPWDAYTYYYKVGPQEYVDYETLSRPETP